MSVLSIQTRRIDGLTEATTAEDEDLLLIRKADGSGTRNIKKKNLIPKIVDKVGDLKELPAKDKTSVVNALKEIRNYDYDVASANSRRSLNIEIAVNNVKELVSYVIQDNAESHNNIFRGKNLGSSLTNTQLQGIRDGTFKDLFVGDYFDFGTQKLRVAHLDYFLERTISSFEGRFPLFTHHLVLISDHVHGRINYDAQRHSYASSDLKKAIESKTIRSEAGYIPGIEDFDVLNLQDYRSPTDDRAKRQLYKSHAGALSSFMVVGRDLMGSSSGVIPTDPQMALFRLSPKMISINYSWWLADSCDDIYAFTVGPYGTIEKGEKRDSCGIRPYYVVTAKRES